MAIILDGISLRDKLKFEIKQEIASLHLKPNLAVILVGDDPASKSYVGMKTKACKDVGFGSEVFTYKEDIKESVLLKKIEELNANPNIHGILVQLPLPKHIDNTKILESIAIQKDVDGFHPYNVGSLWTNSKSFVPATPLGVMKLLAHYNINLKGQNVVIVGASNIVGKPLGALLLSEGATISFCHILTKDLKSHTMNADILCVGVGRVNLITKDMVKEGAIIIDIGINKLESGEIVGDVDFEEVKKKASYITPVPGGVGPMTIASLLLNTLEATKLQVKSL